MARVNDEPWRSGFLSDAHPCPDCRRTVRLSAVKPDPSHVEYRIVCPNGCHDGEEPVLCVEGERRRRGSARDVARAVKAWNARVPEPAASETPNRTRSWHDVTGEGMIPCPVCGVETFGAWLGDDYRPFIGCPEHPMFRVEAPVGWARGVTDGDYDGLNRLIGAALEWRRVTCPQCGRADLTVDDDGYWVVSCDHATARAGGFPVALTAWRRKVREAYDKERERRERVERNRRLLADLNMMEG